MWYVYIIQCKNGKLYTGMTNDLDRRYKEHKRGRGGRFTRSFGVEKLVYSITFPTKEEAMKREIEIKSWSRKKKLSLL